MTTSKDNKINSKKDNLKTIKKETKSVNKKNTVKKNTQKNKINKTTHNKINKTTPDKINKTTSSKNSIKHTNNKIAKKTFKKNTQSGGSDVCSRDLNELLTGNPLVMTGVETDFEGDLNKMGKEFADDVMGSFKGVEDGWAGNPGMPPKLPTGCTIL